MINERVQGCIADTLTPALRIDKIILRQSEELASVRCLKLKL